MKRLTLLSIILTMNYICFSQNLLQGVGSLTPIVQELNKDTLFCFTINQSKVIAGYMEAGIWCDSLMVEQHQWAKLFNQTIAVNDSLVDGLEQKINNMVLLYKNQQTSMDILTKTITLQERKIKRSKAHKLLLGVGMGIMTVVLIMN